MVSVKPRMLESVGGRADLEQCSQFQLMARSNPANAGSALGFSSSAEALVQDQAMTVVRWITPQQQKESYLSQNSWSSESKSNQQCLIMQV